MPLAQTNIFNPGKAVFNRADVAIEESYFLAEPDVIDIFDLKFLQGDAATALDQPN